MKRRGNMQRAAACAMRQQIARDVALQRMLQAQAQRSTQPLRPDQLSDLSLAHHVNVDAICAGQAEPSMLWDFIGGVLCWWKAAQLVDAGGPEMDAQIELAARLCERWSRTGRVLFDGPDMQLARDGIVVMDLLAAQVDIRTAQEAAEWSQREVIRMEAAARQMRERTQDAGATTAGAA